LIRREENILGRGVRTEGNSPTVDEVNIKHHKESILNRFKLEKMVTKNEIIIMTDPTLVSATGLASIDYLKDAVRPDKKFSN